MILGVGFGGGVVIIIIVYHFIKKVNTAVQSNFLQPSANNSSHHNTSHTEAPHTSTFRETTFTLDASKPPPYSRKSYQSPANNLSATPDDVPSYPPPDYASASNYPTMSPDDTPVRNDVLMPEDDVPPPDYTCVLSSNNVSANITYR